jgi:hypothetical protein
MVVGTCGICTADRGSTVNVGTSRGRSDAGMTKQEICDAIASRLGMPKHKLATGKTEPSAFWHAVFAAVRVESLGGRWPLGGETPQTRPRAVETRSRRQALRRCSRL